MNPRTLVLIATLALLPASAVSQSRDTTAATRATEQQRERVRAGQEGFRDGNGNGIDDRIERQGNGTAARKDRFVDADGDGICDGRAGGLGFKRGAMNGQQGSGAGQGKGALVQATVSDREEEVKHATAYAALMLGSLLAVAPAAAQFSVEAEFGTMVDDNVNNNSLRLTDRIISAGLQAGYDWTTDRTNTTLQYNGGYNYFTMVPGRSNQVHAGGLSFAELFGDDEGTLWNAAASYSVRTDREEFMYYDNSAFMLSSSLKHQFTEMFVGRTGYTLRLMRFPNLSSFDHAEHQFFVQSSLFLPSQTTIIGQVDLGMKLYSTPNEDTTVAASGRGRRSSALSSPGVTQLTGSVRVGQSLFAQTGISLTGGYQVNLRKDTRYLGSTAGLIADDEIFDDHYGYEGPQATLMLTQIFPWDIKARVTGTWQRRTYSTQPAFDDLGVQVAAQRLDTRSAINVAVTVPVQPLRCTIGFAYDHIWNASNDPFYAYTNDAFTVQISFP